jgi:chromosome segregation ATPase
MKPVTENRKLTEETVAVPETSADIFEAASIAARKITREYQDEHQARQKAEAALKELRLILESKLLKSEATRMELEDRIKVEGAAARAEIDKLNSTLMKTTTKEASTQAELHKTREAHAKTANELDQLLARYRNLQFEFQQIKTQSIFMSNEFATKATEANATRAELDQLKQEYHSSVTKVKYAEGAVARLVAENRELRNTIERSARQLDQQQASAIQAVQNEMHKRISTQKTEFEAVICAKNKEIGRLEEALTTATRNNDTQTVERAQKLKMLEKRVVEISTENMFFKRKVSNLEQEIASIQTENKQKIEELYDTHNKKIAEYLGTFQEKLEDKDRKLADAKRRAEEFHDEIEVTRQLTAELVSTGHKTEIDNLKKHYQASINAHRAEAYRQGFATGRENGRAEGIIEGKAIASMSTERKRITETIQEMTERSVRLSSVATELEKR